MTLLLFSLCIPFVLFNLLLISTNVRSHGKIYVPALLWWALFIRNCHAIVPNWCCHRGHYHCYWPCLCCALHQSHAWTVSFILWYHMPSVAVLSVSPNGVTTCMHLSIRTATITLGIDMMKLLWVPNHLGSLLLSPHLKCWEWYCYRWVAFHVYVVGLCGLLLW